MSVSCLGRGEEACDEEGVVVMMEAEVFRGGMARVRGGRKQALSEGKGSGLCTSSCVHNEDEGGGGGGGRRKRSEEASKLHSRGGSK